MEGGGENYLQDLQDFYRLKSPRVFPLAVLYSYYSWPSIHIHAYQDQGAMNPVIWAESFVQRGAKGRWLSKLHHISGIFLMKNSKPILGLMGQSLKGCKFQPLKVFNFAALFYFGICLMDMSQSFLWWANRKIIALCDMLHSYCHPLGVWMQNFHGAVIHVLSECRLFGLQVSNTFLNFTAGKIILEAMTWG